MSNFSRCVFSVLFFTGTLFIFPANAEVDGVEIAKGLGLSPEQIEKMENGEVLAFSDAEYENTKRELSADAIVLVKKDLDAVYAELVDTTTVIPGSDLLDHALIVSEDDFADVGFTDDEYEEVEKLFDAEPGDDFNFSNSEYSMLKTRLAAHGKSDKATKISAASDAIRALLLARFQQYQARGLDGIDSYQRSKKKQVNAGEELRLTTEAFQAFEDDFPDYVQVIQNYPAENDCCEHHMRWLKLKVRKRPTFALSHVVIQRTDDFVLLTERQYYISHTANSVQITLAWLRYREDTYMGIAVSASADLLDSMMGRMLRPLGRNKAKDLVTEVLEEIRTDLESDSKN
jgi:hypothetical protein